MKIQEIIDGLTEEIEFMVAMGDAPLMQEAARRELQSQQLEIAKLKLALKQNDDEIKNSESVNASIAALTAAKINGLINENNDLKAKLKSVKADAVKSFGHEIGLYDSEYDDQEYIEVSRNSIRDHIEQLREGKS